MARMNRGATTKLSLKLSADARTKIKEVSKNLNLSQGGTIMFCLSYILKNPPSKTDLINLENKIIFEPGHFPITLKTELARSIDALGSEYKMAKGKMVGLMVSNAFENPQQNWIPFGDRDDTTTQKVDVKLNSDLKKKIVEFSDKIYVPMSGIISAAILNGPYEGFPTYPTREMDSFFTNVPMYIYNKVRIESDRLGIPEHFYIELCVYNVFMSDDKIFEV